MTVPVDALLLGAIKVAPTGTVTVREAAAEEPDDGHLPISGSLRLKRSIVNCCLTHEAI